MLKKIVGTLFSPKRLSLALGGNEIEAVANPEDYARLLKEGRLFKVNGRSAEPIALDGQYLIAGTDAIEPSRLKQFDGRPVIAFDVDGASYFKRLRCARQSIFILESLNLDGTTPAELMSIDGREGIAQVKDVIPVFGVLFEIDA